MSQALLFVDRERTLCKEPYDCRVIELKKTFFVNDVIPTLLRLENAEYSFVMVTNQDGLGTNSFARPASDLCQKFPVELFISREKASRLS